MANCNGDLEGLKSKGAMERQEITKRRRKQKHASVERTLQKRAGLGK